jgi:hypothetical protein
MTTEELYLRRAQLIALEVAAREDVRPEPIVVEPPRLPEPSPCVPISTTLH